MVLDIKEVRAPQMVVVLVSSDMIGNPQAKKYLYSFFACR